MKRGPPKRLLSPIPKWTSFRVHPGISGSGGILTGVDVMKGKTLIRNEEGTVLIIALLMLVLLTVIGISASTISNIEVQVAGNEKFYKIAFYAADGGTEAGSELLEKNIEVRTFPSQPYTLPSSTVTVNDSNFWSQVTQPSGNTATVGLPVGAVGLKIWGNSQLSSGGAIQLIAGYEGKGKGSGGGGAYTVHNVRSMSSSVAASGATVEVLWRHLI
jgi:Tfp pilus assembly protein PilX